MTACMFSNAVGKVTVLLPPDGDELQVVAYTSWPWIRSPEWDEIMTAVTLSEVDRLARRHPVPPMLVKYRQVRGPQLLEYRLGSPPATFGPFDTAVAAIVFAYRDTVVMVEKLDAPLTEVPYEVADPFIKIGWTGG